MFDSLIVFDFNWIICGFSILTKFLTYTFFLKNISPSLIFVNKNILISDNFYRENSGLLWEIGRYVCSSGASRRYRQDWNVCIIICYYYFRVFYCIVFLFCIYNFRTKSQFHVNGYAEINSLLLLSLLLLLLLLLFRILYSAPWSKKKKRETIASLLHYSSIEM